MEEKKDKIIRQISTASWRRLRAWCAAEGIKLATGIEILIDGLYEPKEKDNQD